MKIVTTDLPRKVRFVPAMMICAILCVGAFTFGGCDEESASLSALDPKTMPTAKEARQAMDTISQVKQTSKSVQDKQESFMRLVVFVLIIIGIALPAFFWLLQRKFLAEQEHRLAIKLEQRESDIKNEIAGLERKMLDVTQQQRQQLIAELEQLREKSVELDRTTREMFSEALHNFKNTRIIKRPGFLARLFGFGKDGQNLPENTTIIQINRPDSHKVSIQKPASAEQKNENV